MDTTTDEHDLAKALDSVAAELDAQKSNASDDTASKGYMFSDAAAPVAGDEPVVMPGSPVAPAPTPAFTPSPAPSVVTPAPAFAAPADTPQPSLSTLAPASTGNSDLDAIKKDALVELRPLVDKLTVPPEEKFDTYLLLIRSTDDASLIGPAHDAAKAITDETRRAEALLDIIKEIDYLSKQKSD